MIFSVKYQNYEAQHHNIMVQTTFNLKQINKIYHHTTLCTTPNMAEMFNCLKLDKYETGFEDGDFTHRHIQTQANISVNYDKHRY